MQLKAEAKVRWYACSLALNLSLFIDINIYEKQFIDAEGKNYTWNTSSDPLQHSNDMSCPST